MRPAYGKTEKWKEHTKDHQNKTLTHLYKNPKRWLPKHSKNWIQPIMLHNNLNGFIYSPHQL